MNKPLSLKPKKREQTMTSKKNEVATVDSFENAVMQRPDYMKDAGRGNEEVNSNDITLPRLQIIQDLSPQHKQNKEEYIEGAKVGQMFNTVTKELYDAIYFCPVKLVKEFVLWKDRKAGGGFGGAFPTELEAAKARMEQDNPDQWEVVDTDVHYGIKVSGTPSDPHMEEIVISLSKGTKKASRNLNTLVKLAGGDRFSRLYKVVSVDDLSKNGEDYKNYKFAPMGFAPELVYKRAEEVYEAIEAGLRSVVHADDSEDAQNTAQHGKAEKVVEGQVVEGQDEF